MSIPYPMPSYHFMVEWGGSRTGFKEVSGLNIIHEVVEYREGGSPVDSSIKMPGRTRYDNIILKRGIVKGDNDFFEWIESSDQTQIICAWGAKDMEIIRDECLVHDFEFDQLPKSINLKSQYARMHSLTKEVGLLKALEYTGIEFEGSHHRAKDDAYNTAILFLHYLDQWQY